MMTAPARTDAPTVRPATGRAPSTRWVGRLLEALEVVVGLSGLAGGAYLMARPTTAMPRRLLEGTGFSSWRLPGLALFVLVGLGPVLAVVAQRRGLPGARAGHLVVGVGLVAWIVVEMVWIVVTLPLQLTFAALGVVIAALGVVRIRREPPG